MTKIPKYGEIACELFLCGRSIINGLRECARDNGDPAPTEQQIEEAMMYVREQFRSVK